jgi:SAM-dependent methyltransferase
MRLAEPLAGSRVLDLGCGEGYVARQLVQAGAASVVGIDISSHMIERARALERHAPLGITYEVGSALELTHHPGASFDLVLAVFVLNYLSLAETTAVMTEVVRLMRPGGRFIFTVPHPALPFLRAKQAPLYFDPKGAGYFSGRDRLFEGRIWRRDGVDVPVWCIHKTFGDYFQALANAGFTRLPDLYELGVEDSDVALDPPFFSAVRDEPLHVAIRIRRDA